MLYPIKSILLTSALLLPVILFAQPKPIYKTLEIGDTAPAFNLPGIDDKQHSLDDYKNSDILAIVFTCNHCPTAQAYEERLIKIASDYKDKSFALIAISPNDDTAVRLDELGYTDLNDSLEEMKIRAKDKDFNFPYLYDGENQKVSQAYGAVATPHIFIFDKKRKLQYVGRIDDSDIESEVTSNDTRKAIDALLTGKPVPVPKTRVFGCSVKWAAKRNGVQEADERWEKEPVEMNLIDADGIKKLVENETDNLLLINVWATWCGPCVAEFPDLVNVNRMYRRRDFEMITISMDRPESQDKVLEFLKSEHAANTNYLFDGKSPYDLIELLDTEWQGPIPYTLLIAPEGEIIYRHQGEIEFPELKRTIADYLGRTYASGKPKKRK